MKINYPETLSVYTTKRGKGHIPFIRLAGQWVTTICGFKVGEIVKIDRRRGEIIIRKRG